MNFDSQISLMAVFATSPNIGQGIRDVAETAFSKIWDSKIMHREGRVCIYWLWNLSNGPFRYFSYYIRRGIREVAETALSKIWDSKIMIREGRMGIYWVSIYVVDSLFLTLFHIHVHKLKMCGFATSPSLLVSKQTGVCLSFGYSFEV